MHDDSSSNDGCERVQSEFDEVASEGGGPQGGVRDVEGANDVADVSRHIRRAIVVLLEGVEMRSHTLTGRRRVHTRSSSHTCTHSDTQKTTRTRRAQQAKNTNQNLNLNLLLL